MYVKVSFTSRKKHLCYYERRGLQWINIAKLFELLFL